jgi:hypothetical protein
MKCVNNFSCHLILLINNLFHFLLLILHLMTCEPYALSMLDFGFNLFAQGAVIAQSV